MPHLSTLLSKKINTFFTILGLKRNKRIKSSTILPLKSDSPITNFDKQDKKEVIDSFNKLLNQTHLDKVEYIDFVSKHYRNDGYTVWEYSKEKELPDSEIHLIIKKENKIILIQCHSDHEYLTKKNISNFKQQAALFVAENQIFQSYNIQLLYIMTTLLLEESAYKYIRKPNNINYEILKEQAN
jgi:hypothetical protein